LGSYPNQEITPILIFFKLYHLRLVSILIFRTRVSVSSSSWVIAWFGLEINLIAFIPILIYSPTPSSSEASIKYFLTQALASIIIIFTSLVSIKFCSTTSFDPFNNLISIALGVKAGMAPTHFWFPQIIELINWVQRAILLTWQKIAPLILLFSAPRFFIIFILIISSCLFGSLGGFNINSIKKIIAYSSISHLAWIGASTLISFKIWTIYFLIYSFIVISFIWVLWAFSIRSVNSIYSVVSNKLTKIFILFNILSIGGMPPLLGIFPKIIVIFNFSNFSCQEIFILSALILSSVVTLFFYLKIAYSIVILYNFKPSPSFQNLNIFNSWFSLFVSCSILGNFLIIPVISLF